MHTKNGQQPQVINGDISNRNKLLEIASLNMSTPFYTTPDTIVTTATTVLKNVGKWILVCLGIVFGEFDLYDIILGCWFGV